MVKIFIDAGHGGTDSGANGNGLLEKNLTLQIALEVRKQLLLYESVTVNMSRTTDTTLSLQKRTEMANKWHADYYVSIHINAGKGTGFESYIYKSLSNTSETGKMRSVLHDKITQVNNLRDRGKKTANFHVLRETSMPAVLTENGFIDTASDAKKLKSTTWIKRIAHAHAAGIIYLFRLKRKNPSPNTILYKVAKGDTLSKIARAHKMTVDEVVDLNKLIKAGQTLRLYTENSTKIKVGEKVTVKSSAEKYATGELIPPWVKGRSFTIAQIRSNQVLLKEINSWVKRNDVK